MIVMFALIGDDIGDGGVSRRVLIPQFRHLAFQMIENDALNSMGSGGNRATAQHGGE